jgi:hypothetical protein
MSVPTAARPTATSRQPLSLRELFCLTTLAAILLMLDVRFDWTSEEHNLLRFSAGGALLGLLACRLSGRRGAIAALLLGGLGAAIAVGLTVPGSIKMVRGVQPEYSADVAWEKAWAGATTFALGCAMGATVVLLFALLNWLLASDAKGFAVQCRKRPVVVGLLALLVCGGLALAGNSSGLLHPEQWRPFAKVTPRRDGQVIELGGSELALSRDGRWLGLAVEWYTCNYVSGDSDQGTWLFALHPTVQQLSLDGLNSHEAYEIAFAPDQDRLAALKKTGDQVDELRIWDLASRTPLPSLQRSERIGLTSMISTGCHRAGLS